MRLQDGVDCGLLDYLENKKMDSHIFKIFISITLFFCLLACTSLPTQSFTFSLVEGDAKTSSWSQRKLASSAEMVFKFRLRQSFPKAAEVRFSFYGLSKDDPEVSVQLYDEKCSGAYEIAVNYKSGSREFRNYYFKTKLLWDESSTITIQWQGSDRVSITVNNKEVHELDLQDSIRGLNIDVRRGGIDIDELLYRNLES